MNKRRMRWSIAASTIVVCSITAASIRQRANAGSIEPRAFEQRRNVILVTVSTLRADHVGCLGYSRDTTPCFDAFAKENIVFRNAFATSGWMMPAHGSIWTSLHPSFHGATHIDKSLGDEHSTLAEILSDNGYYCVGFCCSPRLDQGRGFAQGFDMYDDYSVPLMLDSLAFGNGGAVDINKQRTNALVNDAAIGWLKKNTHKPFFMFVHYYDNHWDYLPPAPYRDLYDPEYEGPVDGTEIAREPLFSNPPEERDIEHIVALYDGEVKQTDNDLGEFVEALKGAGLLDNSIVLILADHGEQFYEHGHTSHHGVYEELIRIPLAVSVPDNPAKGKVIDSLVSEVDILPTILDYLGIQVPGQCQGKSFKPVIEGKVTAVNDFVFAEYTGGAAPDTFAVRSDRYKYFQEAGSDPFAYDLAKDPGERDKIRRNDFPPDIRILEEQLKHLKSE